MHPLAPFPAAVRFILPAAALALGLLLGACKDKAAPPKPAPTPTPTPARPVAADPAGNPEAPRAVANVNTDLKDDVNAKTRMDVMERIDRMPNLSAEQRNKLYSSVDRARGMGCVLIVPFSANKRTLGEAERTILINAVRAPAVKRLSDDPSLVFVIIGYSNEGADASASEKLSIDRSENILATLRDQGGVLNPMYAVGLGNSDPKRKDPGAARVAEIWTIFP